MLCMDRMSNLEITGDLSIALSYNRLSEALGGMPCFLSVSGNYLAFSCLSI